MTPTVLFMAAEGKPDPWRDAFLAQMPGVDFRVWNPDPALDQTGDKSEIDYAVVWKPAAGVLASLPNLKAVFSMGAGVDHLFGDPELPKDVPLVRLVDRCLTQRIVSRHPAVDELNPENRVRPTVATPNAIPCGILQGDGGRGFLSRITRAPWRR